MVSSSRDLDDYTSLGVSVEKVAQQEVADLYAEMNDQDGEAFYKHFKNRACAIKEPNEQDLRSAGRMVAAIIKLMDNYKAEGIAIACFNLLGAGTTACLALSYINDCTDKIAACEGDLDSACTMLFMKKLAATKLWMANPGLHPNGLVNFSHCTAPIGVDAGCSCNYTLRNHHESGIGVSLQVELPQERRLTACRISAKTKTMTIQNGTSVSGEYEHCCRTQLYVKFDDFSQYIDTALGCHQVFCFEDIKQDAEALAKMLGIKIITQ